MWPGKQSYLSKAELSAKVIDKLFETQNNLCPALFLQ